VAFCCENTMGRASLIQGGEFLNLSNDYQFLIKGSAPLKEIAHNFLKIKFLEQIVRN
jgi:hypothetical protein